MKKKTISFIFLIFIFFILLSCDKTATLAPSVSSTTKTITTLSPSELVTTKDPSTTLNILTKGEEYYSLINKKYGSSILYQKYDMYLPLDFENNEKVNVVLFIHGGAWITGSKDGYGQILPFLINLLTKEKIVVINMDYRLANMGKSSSSIYEMKEDVANCLNDASRELSNLGLEVDNLAIGGHSAGGHIALLYGYSEICPMPLKFLYSLSGPTDLTDEMYLSVIDGFRSFLSDEQVDNMIKNITKADSVEEGLAKMGELSPIRYVNSNSLPTIIFHGDKDSIVPYQNSVDLVNKLNEFNIGNELVTLSDADHMDTVDYSNLESEFLLSFKNFISEYFK